MRVRVALLVLLPLAACNHYTTLGVSPRADAAEIKTAYRKLALKEHPDKQREPKKIEQAAERFKKITEAYETLSDPTKRRQYDMQRANPFTRQQQQQQGFGGGGAYGFQTPPGFAFSGGEMPFYFRQRPVVPPPRARRAFYCSLDELHDGCTRKYVLTDGPVSRLRDAISDRFEGPAGEALVRTLGFAASLAWRFPSLCFGRPWWLRLPVCAVAFAFALSQQLPPSPEGVFEFDVVPGWRSGTKVAFSKRGPRAVAFELRERKHPRLGRRGKSDLVYKASCARRAALDGGAHVTAVDLGGTKHTVEVSISEEEAASAAFVVRRLPELGLPKASSTDGEKGDLIVEIRLTPPLTTDVGSRRSGPRRSAA